MMTTPTMTMRMTSAIIAAIQPQQKEDLLAGKAIKVRLNDFVVAELSLETELGQIIAALVKGSVPS